MSKNDRDLFKHFSLIDNNRNWGNPFSMDGAAWATGSGETYKYMLVGQLLMIWFESYSSNPNQDGNWAKMSIPTGLSLATGIDYYIGDILAYSGGVSEDGEAWADPTNNVIRLYREDRQQITGGVSFQVAGFVSVAVTGVEGIAP